MTTHHHGRQRHYTDVDYIDSIEDPFFKLVGKQVVAVGTNGAQHQNLSDIEKATSAKERLEALEISVRKKLLGLLLLLQESGDRNSNDQKTNTNTNGAATTTAADVIGVFWKSSLDLCHHLVHQASSSSPSKPDLTNYENLMPCRRLPYLLLSDCLEGLPLLDDSKSFWSDYVEPELINTVLFGDKFWSQFTETNNSKKFSLSSSHLPFLKVVNQFLKRLEHASDNGVRVEWKGRIMWALSKGFSITDKSSLKSWGSFHANNGTDFESKEEFNKYNNVGITASTHTIQYNLYEAFWSLQNNFSNPNKINVVDFIKRLRLVLAAMESATATNSSTVIPEHGDENGGIDKQTTKYLTSSALLPPQLQDSAFRSSVATQFLIVASHLGAESPPLKNALASLVGRARKLLKNDNPELHDILWESILVSGREDHWRTWKKQKCATNAFAPNFKRNQQLVFDSAAATDYQKSHKKKRRLAKDDDNRIVREEVVSSLSRNFLNKNDLITVSRDLLHKLPTLDEHMEPYVEALDPESGIEDEYHPKNDSLFTWRAMRLYAKHQLPLMSQCRKPADLEKITRKWYQQSHGIDIPGEMPALDESDNKNDNKKKADTDSADDHLDNDRNDSNRNDSTAMDIDTKDNEMQEEAQKQGTDEMNNEDELHSNDADEDEDKVASEIENAQKMDKDQPKVDILVTNENESEEIESANEKKENSGPTKEIPERPESDIDGKATKSTTDIADEQRPRAKNIEESKSNTAIGTTTNNRKNDKEQNRNNKNYSQRQEKHPPRENVAPQNRGGWRRGSDEEPNSQQRGRRDDGPPPRRGSDEELNSQQRGRRDDGLPPRRGIDDNYQSRGGRSSGDSLYRGRSDGPPSRGGRYDEDYSGDSSRRHGDTRGDRFNGERSNRSTGRDNHRGGDRGGGIGRDDNRGGRSRVGGGGRQRQRR